MESKDKKDVKEAIQITTDSPEEAGMMMQILKLAGVKPMGADMPDMEPKAEPETDTDDATGSMDMARMRNMVTAPDEEKQEETFANEPEEKTPPDCRRHRDYAGGFIVRANLGRPTLFLSVAQSSRARSVTGGPETSRVSSQSVRVAERRARP